MKITSWQLFQKQKKIFFLWLVIFLLLLFSPLILYAGDEVVDDLFGVSFPTAKDGWACGRWGTIVHTIDGGKTWEKQESGTDYTLSSLCFFDPQKGWAVGNGGTIITTSDGGKSWKHQKSPVTYYLMKVHFANPQKGWIVTERTTILYTENGGDTWQIQFKDKDFILISLSFCDEQNGWAVGEYGFIYHTSDGGKTWEHQAGEFGISIETGEVVGGDYLFDVVAIDSKTAWVVGIDGHVSKTVDGGSTWQRIEGVFPKIHLLGISIDRKGTIIIEGVGSLFTSSDGGKTFRERQNDPTLFFGWLNGSVYNGAGRFIAVGKEGWVYLTDNNGVSWQMVPSQNK
jgi:photosystem II stability/assembly factor-like uncharacterized protein